jgi:hypothetical protein
MQIVYIVTVFTEAINALRYDPKTLKEMIVSSERPDVLLKLCLEHGRAFNYLKVTTPVHRLA